MNSIFPFFKWLDSTIVNKTINNSNWLFPAIEGVHIVALAMLLGAVIVLNLRVLNVGFRSVSASRLERELAPWLLCSLVAILISGALLFASEAVKSFYSNPFRIKILLLVTAIVFHYTIGRRVISADRMNPWLSKPAALLAIVLWVSVGLAGRGIAFF
jgi:succinate dehydrogenase hydrophobic anchor subunit